MTRAAADKRPRGRRGAAWLARAGVLPLLALAAGCGSASDTPAGTVVIDGGLRHQTIAGFGSSERAFEDPHVFNNSDPSTGRALTTMTRSEQDALLDRLYRDLQLRRVRAAGPDTAPGQGIEPVNDNADPGVADLSKFDFSGKRLDAHCDYFVRARERGATAFFLSPLNRERWMGVTTPNDAAEYAEWLLAQVQQCASRGIALPYVSVANEPSVSNNGMSGAFVRDVIKILGPRLGAAGLKTMFVMPDDERASSAAAVAAEILADPDARPYVGALATHLYGEPLSNVGAFQRLAARYRLPVWMTEFSQAALPRAGLSADPFAWASLMHRLLSTYDVSAIDYIWGFFGEWEGDATALVSLTNDGARYTGPRLNKTYYTMGQFSRFVAPGAQRVSVRPGASPAEVSAYVSSTAVTIVAVNDTDASKRITLELKRLPTVARLAAVRTSKTENWARLSPIASSGTSFRATLPAKSVTTFRGSFRAGSK